MRVGINIDLMKSALIAFGVITLAITLINSLKVAKEFIPNYSLQLGSLIGNTSFLGIPIAIAILPTEIINFTIGFDLGTTLFAWVMGPYLLKRKTKNTVLNFQELIFSILNSPASKGLIGVLIAYTFSLEEFLGNILWIPARIVIVLAIIVVGTRLGIITKNRTKLFDIENRIKFATIVKLFILPFVVFIICNILNFSKIETLALVLQAGTPSAISTILMAEAYKKNQDIAAKTLFSTTLLSIITIPLIVFFLEFN